MLFVEPFFLFVVMPLALAGCFLAARLAGPTAALGILVLVSAVFYAPYGPLPAAILTLSLLINLALGMALAQGAGLSQAARKALLALGLAGNFLALAFFKYFAPHLAGTTLPAVLAAIPAGISFYTFHQSVFLLNAFQRAPEVTRFLAGPGGALGAGTRYAAFVAFFPQLVIGPITYLSEFAPQVLRAGFGRLKRVNLKVGAALITIGLFKKLCIADPLAATLNPIYALADAGTPLSSQQSVFAVLGFYFQLYFDFSGYSDIALGIARLFGIRLPINFDSPLRSTGIVDFYRRWHITLTRVIALFLFTPLSLAGTRYAIDKGLKGWRRRALGSWLPFLANFQVIALWHAAKATFVVFGLWHGLWFVIENEIRATKAFKAFRARTSERTRFLAGLAITLVPLSLTFALFRCDTLHAFGLVLQGFFNGSGAGKGAAVHNSAWQMLALAGAIIYLLPNAYEWLRNYRPGIFTFTNPSSTLNRLRIAFRPDTLNALLLVVLWGFIVLRLNKPAPFLYAGF